MILIMTSRGALSNEILPGAPGVTACVGGRRAEGSGRTGRFDGAGSGVDWEEGEEATVGESKKRKKNEIGGWEMV